MVAVIQPRSACLLVYAGLVSSISFSKISLRHVATHIAGTYGRIQCQSSKKTEEGHHLIGSTGQVAKTSQTDNECRMLQEKNTAHQTELETPNASRDAPFCHPLDSRDPWCRGKIRLRILLPKKPEIPAASVPMQTYIGKDSSGNLVLLGTTPGVVDMFRITTPNLSNVLPFSTERARILKEQCHFIQARAYLSSF